MQVFVTGMCGFAADYLAAALVRRGREVHGGFFPDGASASWPGRHPEAKALARVTLHTCDVRDSARVRALVEALRPDQIYHLAAATFVPESFENPRLALDVNLNGPLNLFESVRAVQPDCHILCVTSAEIYGLVREEDLPLRETSPLRPLSPYSVSKAAADLLAYQYAHSYGLRIVRVRPFNHTGPVQGPRFVCSDFARQIAQAERGEREPVLHVGNLDSERDFTDVRDMVEAYVLALEMGKAGDAFNLGSGVSVSIGEIARRLVEKSRIPIEIRTDPRRKRPVEVPIVRGDFSLFRSITGWKPAIPLDRTLQDLLDYWRSA